MSGRWWFQEFLGRVVSEDRQQILALGIAPDDAHATAARLRGRGGTPDSSRSAWSNRVNRASR